MTHTRNRITGKVRGGSGHPAKFSPQILEVFRDLISREVTKSVRTPMPLVVLDPFGGVGGIHDIKIEGMQTDAIEIEPEWAKVSESRGFTWCGDFFQFDPRFHRFHHTKEVEAGYFGKQVAFPPLKFDIIATSPTYGNRMADSHTPSPEDLSTRITYRHKLGRRLTENNSGGMQWGQVYRAFHVLAWNKVVELLSPDGLFILNVSDHIRKGERQPVVAWHRAVVRWHGMQLVQDIVVPTRRMRMGENHAARVEGEHVLVFRKLS